MSERRRRDKLTALLALHGVIVLYSLGGIASKTASGEPFLSFHFFFFYGLMILDMLIYAILWQQILKKIPLTTAISNKAINIAWGILWGVLFFHEVITWNMILGALIVGVGICLVVSEDE